MSKRTMIITENCEHCNGNGFVEKEIELQYPKQWFCETCNQIKTSEGDPCQCDFISRNGD